MNENEITAKLVISALNQIGSMFAATADELKKIREILEQNNTINKCQSAPEESVNQSILECNDVTPQFVKPDKKSPKAVQIDTNYVARPLVVSGPARPAANAMCLYQMYALLWVYARRIQLKSIMRLRRSIGQRQE